MSEAMRLWLISQLELTRPGTGFEFSAISSEVFRLELIRAIFIKSPCVFLFKKLGKKTVAYILDAQGLDEALQAAVSTSDTISLCDTSNAATMTIDFDTLENGGVDIFITAYGKSISVLNDLKINLPNGRPAGDVWRAIS